MKIIINKIKDFIIPVLLLAAMVSVVSCKKEGSAAPSITSVRNYVASPGDTLLNHAGSGQWVVINGNNLGGCLQILFDGVATSFNSALFSNTTAVVLIPTIPYNNVAANSVNTITYITTGGSVTFSFALVPPPPTITSISNENGLPGDSVTIYGTNLFYIQSINFGGGNVTVFKGSSDGTSMGIRVPALDTTKSAPCTVTTKSGTYTTVYPVNISTGSFVLMNFDNIGTLAPSSTGVVNALTENNPTLFPSNRGKYIRLNPTAVVPANDFGYKSGARAIYSTPTPWVPAANMTDPIASWALKFEIYCQKPFANGVIYIEPSIGTWYYANRFEPWKITPNYFPQGWTTITIPLNQFLAPLNGTNGIGAPPPTLTDLLVTNIPQTTGPCVRFNLCGSTAPVFLDFAIDNIRCVKIQ